MIESIRKSLACDFRNIQTRLGHASRASIDEVFQMIRNLPLTDLACLYKDYAKQLCSCPSAGEVAHLGDLEFITAGDPVAIQSLKQAIGFFSRLHANVDQETQLSQLRETAVRFESDVDLNLTAVELEHARYFIRRMIGRRPPDVRNLRFRHGPGAVATREKGAEKLYFRQTFMKVDAYLGYDSEVLLRLPHQPLRALERTDPITRVIAVPKDALKIRTISCEPLTMQFFQQGLMDELYRRMFRRPGNHFPFEDQARALHLARLGSECTSWGRSAQPCTIDLSNASDDVKIKHVEALFPAEWAECLLAFRSEEAWFPKLDHVSVLKTFAPMGAATCFPVESLVFASLRYAAERTTGRRVAGADWTQVGDDTITPAFTFSAVCDLYTRAGFHLNVSKSCGPEVRFRESCGGEFFEGVDVSIVRPRLLPKFNTFHATAPTVQLVSALNSREFRQTSQLIANTIRGPVAIGDGPAYAPAGYHYPCIGRRRYNVKWQRWEQQTMVEIPWGGTLLSDVEGWEPLYNWFTSHWRSETRFSNGRTKSVRTWLPCQVSDA